MANLQDDTLGALTVAEFCEMYRIGVSTFYTWIDAGRIKTVKAGKKRLVLRRDAIEFEKSLSAPTTAA